MGRGKTVFTSVPNAIDALANYGKREQAPEEITYNEILLMGYLAKDPVDKTRSSLPVVELVVMTDEGTAKSPARPETHRVIVFSEPIIRQARKFQKGDRVLLAGRYQNHSFKVADGGWVNLYEIVTTRPQLVNHKHSD